MVFLIALATVVAVLLVLWLIDRSPITRRLRERILERDRAYRESLRPAQPWEPERGNAWPVTEREKGEGSVQL